MRPPEYDAAFGVAHAVKDGEKASGDTHSVIKINEHRFMMALCDKIMVLCHGKVMGVVHADKTTKEDLGLMMTGSKDLVSEKKDKKLGKAKDSNLSEEQWQAAENAEEKTEDAH